MSGEPSIALLSRDLLWANTLFAGAKSHFVYPQSNPDREITKTVVMTFVPPEYTWY